MGSEEEKNEERKNWDSEPPRVLGSPVVKTLLPKGQQMMDCYV